MQVSVFIFQSDFGDVSDRKALRQSLNCHSFDWFMNNVVNDSNENPKHARKRGEVGIIKCSRTFIFNILFPVLVVVVFLDSKYVRR